VIDYRSVDFTEAVAEVDIVVDPIGEDYTARSAAVLKDGGYLMSVIPGELSEAEQQRINAGFILVEADWSGMRALSALVDAGTLTPHVAETYPLEAVAKAHESLAAGHATGKIVLTVA
jgi:NADPH:quinone reductase-like Zn-dependent oxidoreductase